MTPTHWPHTLETLQLACVNVFACYERSAVTLNSCVDGVCGRYETANVCEAASSDFEVMKVCVTEQELYKLNMK